MMNVKPRRRRRRRGGHRSRMQGGMPRNLAQRFEQLFASGGQSFFSIPGLGEIQTSKRHEFVSTYRPWFNFKAMRDGQTREGQSEDLQSGQTRNAQSLVAPTTLEHRCQRHFPRRAKALGRDYFNSGRVSEPTRVEQTFVFEVRGSGVNYKSVLDFTSVPTNKTLEARCDCPYYDGGGLCKHLWASILQVDKAGLGSDVPETGQLKVQHVRPRSRRDERQPAHGSAQAPALPVPNVTPVVVKLPPTMPWMAKLDQIQGITGAKTAPAFGGTWLAYFVINAAETITAGKLVVDLWTRDRLSNGDLGPLKPNRLPTHDLTRFSDPRDQEVLSVLGRTCEPKTFAPFGRTSGTTSRFKVDPILETHLIPALTSAGKLFLSRSPNGSPDDADRPLRIDRGKPWEVDLKIEVASPTHYRLDGLLRRDGETRGVHEPLCIFKSSYMLFGDRIGRLSDPKQSAWALALRSPEAILVPREQGDSALKRLLSDPAVAKISWPDEMGWSTEVLNPRPKGVFRELGNTSITGRMILTVSFDYAGRLVSLDDTSKTLIDLDNKRVYDRNFAFEDQTLAEALKILRDDQGTGTIPSQELHRAATELTQNGWVVYIDNKRLVVADQFSMNVSTSTDWFDLKMEASFDNSSVGQMALLAALEAKNGLVKLSDGSLGMLPKEWLSRYEQISQFGEKTADGGLRFNKSQGLMLNAALSDEASLKADSGFLSFRDRIAKFDGVSAVKAPKGFRGKLRNYQKEGLSWLGFVEEFEMGGILADDMGLGKTIQILAFLRSRAKKGSLPSLVVAPRSLVFNWLDEASKFVPDLKVICYAGAGRSKQLKEIQDADLVVTTYGTLRTDIEKLKEFEFDVAIVDEAQAIKNAKSQSAAACKELRAKHRLALTGTPIENSITDLFSILEFTSPGLLTLSQEREIGKDTRDMLSKMLKPFVLRRTKEKVLTELPEKSEQVLYCEMSPTERNYYSALRDHYRATLTGQIEKSGLGRSKMHVLEALLRLRQAACHPGLVDPSKKTEISAKLGLLVSQIKEVIEEGHKALVFSQFTSLLDLVKESFDQDGIVYEYLDGQTVDRKRPVERFQTDPNCPVFLISLKAGGTGLNLTAADYVFILDPWWNPAVEAQAIGRAHRLGQSQKVFAYRMIARGTVEEKILELQKTKRDLAESIFSEDKDFLRKLTREDLEMLLT